MLDHPLSNRNKPWTGKQKNTATLASVRRADHLSPAP